MMNSTSVVKIIWRPGEMMVSIMKELPLMMIYLLIMIMIPIKIQKRLLGAQAIHNVPGLLVRKQPIAKDDFDLYLLYSTFLTCPMPESTLQLVPFGFY